MGNTGSKLNIYKQHILLLANADIVIPVYHVNKDKYKQNNKKHTTSAIINGLDELDPHAVEAFNNEDDDIESIQSDVSSDLNEQQEQQEQQDEYNASWGYYNQHADPYSDFFNCIVENTEYMSFGDIDKSINNNELKYIYYSNPTNFLNLIKFLCYKTIRTENKISKFASGGLNNNENMGTSNPNFQNDINTLLNCIRILTKIIPIFFELCYNENDKGLKFVDEDSVFWNSNTAEVYDLAFKAFKHGEEADFAKSTFSTSSFNEKAIPDFSSLKVSIKYEQNDYLSSEAGSKDNTASFVNTEGEGKEACMDDLNNDTPLGTTLLTSLMKILFMDGFTLRSKKDKKDGYTSFELWENGITSLKKDFLPLDPSLDANRIEVLRLIEVLCGNCLYSSSKIDNKFLASWCCCMPEYLSIYLITSLINVLVRSCHYLKNDYPQEYTLMNKQNIVDNQFSPANKELQLVKTNTASSVSTNITINNKNNNNNQSHQFTYAEATQLRETYITTATQVLNLYFQFDQNSLSPIGCDKIWSSSELANPVRNVAHRFFATLQDPADFKIILVAFNKILKHTMNEKLETENNIFSLNPQKFNIFNYFGGSNKDAKSNNRKDSNQESKGLSNLATSENSENGGNQSGEQEDVLPAVHTRFNSVLLLLWKFMQCNRTFEKFIMDKYSNKLFITLFYYLKVYSLKASSANVTIPLIAQFALYFTSSPYFLFKSLQYLQEDYYSEKLPEDLKILGNASVSNTTYRDFAIMHLSRIALQDIQSNNFPKSYIYEMLYNLLLATPMALKGCVCEFSEVSINLGEQLELEFQQTGNRTGNYLSGISYQASAQIIQLLYKSSNKQYLTSFSNLIKSKSSFSKSIENSLRNNRSSSTIHTIETSSQLIDSNNETKKGLPSRNISHNSKVTNFLTKEYPINITKNSKKPYAYTPAAKLDNFSLIIRGICNLCVKYYSDSRNLIFALARYQKVLLHMKQTIQEVNVVIEKQIEPLLLREIKVPLNSKKIPYDISINTTPTLLDDVCDVGDDLLNPFDASNDSLLKGLTFQDSHKEDIYYFQNNTSLYYNGSNKVLEKQNQYERKKSLRNLATNSENLNMNKRPETSSGSKFIFERSSYDFQPNVNNNLVYQSIRPKRPIGLTTKMKKKMVLHSSDKLRQYILPRQTNHVWFLGEPYFELLYKLTLLVSSSFPEISSLPSSQYFNIVLEISKQEADILSELSGIIPPELSKAPVKKLLSNDLFDGSIAYQWLQTLIWMDIFNMNSVEYQPNLDGILEHNDLLELSRSNNIHTAHDSVVLNTNKNVMDIVKEEEQLPPSSPMLDRWMSHNSLTRSNSNASFLNNDSLEDLTKLALDNSKQTSQLKQGTNGRSSINSPNLSNHAKQFLSKNISSEISSSPGSSNDKENYQNIFGFGWNKSKEENTADNVTSKNNSNFTSETGGEVQSYFVDHEILSHLLWNNTRIAMFEVSIDEREEFSIMDMTSSLLNKFRFKSVTNNTHETSNPKDVSEEIASLNLRTTSNPSHWTPRNSISSATSFSSQLKK